jgi:hypothetical protein
MARYENVFWPKLGVIMTIHNESPKYMVTERWHSKGHWALKEARLPKLQYWSDVVYLNWQIQAKKQGADVRNLKYVFVRRVRNERTLKILAYVLLHLASRDEPSVRAPQWPLFRSIRCGDPGFAAMLYTPCVRGTVKLLTQYRRVFGGRRIYQIKVGIRLRAEQEPC